jgi:hypothetical protein
MLNGEKPPIVQEIANSYPGRLTITNFFKDFGNCMPAI